MATEAEVNDLLSQDAHEDDQASASIARTAATATEQGNIQTNIKQQQAVKTPGAASSFVTDPGFWHDVGQNYVDLNKATVHGMMHGAARALDLVTGNKLELTKDIDSSPSIAPSNPDGAPAQVGEALGGLALAAPLAPEAGAGLALNAAKQAAFWAAVGYSTGDDRNKDALLGAAGGAGGELASAALKAGGAFLKTLFAKGGTEIPLRAAETASHGLPPETVPWTPDTVAGADTAAPKPAGTATPELPEPGYTKHQIPSSQLDSKLQPKDGWQFPDNATSFVAKDAQGNQIAHVTTVPTAGQMRLLRMDTVAEHQGKGIATDLLGDAIDHAHANDMPYVSDTQMSTGAQKAHERVDGISANGEFDKAHDATDGDVHVSANGRPLYEAPVPPEGAAAKPSSTESASSAEAPAGPPVFDPKAFVGQMVAQESDASTQALRKAITSGDLGQIGALQKFMPNLPWHQLAEGGNLQATFHALADHYGGEIRAVGGAKVIPKEMQLQFAANQGRDPQTVMTALDNLGQHTDDGGLAARVLAGHHLDIETGFQLHAAAQAVSDATVGSAEHVDAVNQFNAALEMKLAVQSVMSGAKNELGRSLGALRYMNANRALVIPDGFGDGKTATDIADALLKSAKGKGGGINLQGLNEKARAIKAIGPTDWLLEMMRNGLLSSPALHWVNAKANVLRMGVSLLEQYAAGAVGAVSKGIGTVVHAAADAAGVEMQPMQQQLSLRSANAYTLGAWNSVTDRTVWTDAAMKSLHDATVDYNGQPARLAIKGNIKLSDLPNATQGVKNIQGIVDMANSALDAAGKVVRTPGRLLGTVDHLNVTIAQRASMTQQAFLRASSMADASSLTGEARSKFLNDQMKELLLNPTDGMMTKAQADGSYASMQEPAQLRPSFFGLGGDMTKPGMGAAVNNALNKNKLIKMLVAPFTTRPGNAFRQAIVDYTPIGALFDKTTQSALAGGGTNMNLAAARVMMGTTVMWQAWNLADSGHLSGSSQPGDLSQLSDRPDYSLKVGDTSIPIKRMEPAGLWLAAMADAYQAVKSRSTTYDIDGNPSSPPTRALMAFAMASGHLFTEMPAMSGLKRLLDVMTTRAGANLEQKGINFVGGAASEVVPFSGLGSWINNNTDGHRHVPDNIWQAICQRIPGMEGDIRVDRDVFGRPKNAINQYAATTGAQDTLSKAVSSVQGNIKPDRHWLVAPTDGQQGVPLDDRLANELETIKGEKKLPGLGNKTFPEYATQFIEGPHWQNAGKHGSRAAPDGGNYEHMDMLTSLLAKGNGEAWRQLYANHPDLRQRQRAAAEAQIAPVRPQ